MESSDLSDLAPAEYRADLVVLLVDGKPVLGIVVEVQLHRDDRKPFTWAGVRRWAARAARVRHLRVGGDAERERRDVGAHAGGAGDLPGENWTSGC